MEKELLQNKLLEVEAEIYKLENERREAYSRQKQAIDEELLELRPKAWRLRDQLEELEKKSA